MCISGVLRVLSKKEVKFILKNMRTVYSVDKVYTAKQVGTSET